MCTEWQRERYEPVDGDFNVIEEPVIPFRFKFAVFLWKKNRFYDGLTTDAIKSIRIRRENEKKPQKFIMDGCREHSEEMPWRPHAK